MPRAAIARSSSTSSKSKAQLKREIAEALPAAGARSTSPSAGSKFVSGDDYDTRSKAEARRRLDRVRHAPLEDRREAKANFLEAMRDAPSRVAERISWLLDGNYGYGEMLLAQQILRSPRMNRRAALTQMIGALEWMCTENDERLAWKALSKAQQAKLDSEIDRVIEEAEVTL